MNHLTVTDAFLEDAESLAPRLRREDLAEVWAASGLGGLEALRRSLDATQEPKAILEDRQVIAIFGVATMAHGLGAPWLLGSPRILTHGREFARRSREQLELVRRPFARLTNYVDARQTEHHRWLRWLGARFIHLEPEYGFGRLPFWLFEL